MEEYRESISMQDQQQQQQQQQQPSQSVMPALATAATAVPVGRYGVPNPLLSLRQQEPLRQQQQEEEQQQQQQEEEEEEGDAKPASPSTSFAATFATLPAQPQPPSPIAATVPRGVDSAFCTGIRLDTGSRRLTGRPPIMLYLSCDADVLSPYQCLVRQHVVLFEANDMDLHASAQGRNRPIVLGQVGLSCKHCRRVRQQEYQTQQQQQQAQQPPQRRGSVTSTSGATATTTRGAVFFPSTLLAIYQSAQTVATVHLCESCPHLPPGLREQLRASRQTSATSSSAAGKEFWAANAQALGVYEDRTGGASGNDACLRFYALAF